MSTTKTQHGVTNLGAPASITPSTIALNGPTLMYRIGLSDMDVMALSGVPSGFVSFNQTNGKAFLSVGSPGEEIWTALGAIGNLDDFDPTLIPRWDSTLPTYAQPGATVGSNEISNESGYRIGNSDRTIGDDASDVPDGFLVYNQGNKSTFVASGGVWADGGTFPPDLYAAWADQSADFSESDIIEQIGTARIQQT